MSIGLLAVSFYLALVLTDIKTSNLFIFEYHYDSVGVAIL
jgi:hypothetical protein